ncbi:MAG: methylated-DNA--[Clostridia bacterium]|nr:methylated-DNA--[protein]-cysteine S-methyltransferase [Clostridia bacterium]
MTDSFFQKVYAVVEQIPCGKVISYGDIAKLIGYPRRARFVGFAMRACPDHLPWHRVIRSDGSIAGGDFAPVREMLLRNEGIPFLPDGRVDLQKCRAVIPDATDKS